MKDEDKKSEKSKGVDTVVSEIKEKFGDGVIMKLGDVKHVDTKTVEKLYTADLAYLQNLYRQINDIDAPRLHVACPKCDHYFEVEVDFLSLTEGHS